MRTMYGWCAMLSGSLVAMSCTGHGMTSNAQARGLALLHRDCDTLYVPSAGPSPRAPVASPDSLRGTITGTVVESRTEAALLFVRVRLAGHDTITTVTDVAGGFRVDGRPGSYELTAARVAFRVSRVAVSLRAGSLDTLVVRLAYFACP